MKLFPHLPCAALVITILTGCAASGPTISRPPIAPPSPATAPPPPQFEQSPLTPYGVRTPVDPATVRGVPPVVLSGAPVEAIADGPLKPLAQVTTESTEVTPTKPPADLWDRIRRGFAMPDLDTDLVRDQEQWYATRPDYIERMTERSRKYLFHIVEELERRNMPTELALLPFIESAFNPQAVSSAKAAGMWQFMPTTGRYFDLKQNVFRDDRRDVLASTRAALDYLQKLHGMFGDWHLALAAYNWGEGSVGRAIAKNQRAGLGVGYTDLTMPNETRYYVPKLQAVKNIVTNPDALNVDLPAIENHPYFQSVTITRDIDVSLAAQLAQVPLADFKALNSAAHRPVIFAAGTPQILLPWDNAEVFRRNLQAHTSGQFASWTAWTVPKTMKVAEVAKRVGMSESDLRSINNIPPRYLIKTGSTLLVTRSAKARDDVAEHVADNGQIAFTPEVVTRRVLAKARKKETVASLAKRYKVSATSVAEWNKVAASAAFRTGQQVVLYLPIQPKTARPSVKAKSRIGTAAKSTASKRAVASSSTKARITQRPAPKRTAAAKK